ncbi:DUF726-domain-containing protein [Microthyrium microscopicum]|uniref:DUF726-domain-containing protein n=1 Tax=Microthyrium microscopicum TaxID=703497 RepID=A0A6A6URF7_9PEZI|nr:DUF726-domain-containing protein [Microthyrium microscopicum]
MPADDPPANSNKSDDNGTKAGVIAEDTPKSTSNLQEIDEWGLPIKKAIPKKVVEEDDDGSSEGNFEDAPETPVESKGKVDAPITRNTSTSSAEALNTLSTTKSPNIINPATPASTGALPKSELSDKTADSKSQTPPTQNAVADKVAPVEEKDGPGVIPEDASPHVENGITIQPGKHTVQTASEWSHQQLAPMKEVDDEVEKEEDWQTMPAFAPFNIYNDDGKLVAKEHEESDDEANQYGQLGGAGKGYTRVQLDEDAQSATSMDENTAYLFKEPSTNLMDEDEEGRDMVAQMQTTKTIMTETQRIAYVGIVRLAMIEMMKEFDRFEKSRKTKKFLSLAREAMAMWSQKIMVRLYSHMEIESAEQIMIEQLAAHGVQPSDMTPSLMQNARVKNPMRTETAAESSLSVDAVSEDRKSSEKGLSDKGLSVYPTSEKSRSSSPRTNTFENSYGDDDEDLDSKPNQNNMALEEEQQEPADEEVSRVQDPSEFSEARSLDVDIRWTVLCDLFLVLIADSIYDSRSRRLLELIGSYLDVSVEDICRFEKRVTDALEMQEAANKENWNEEEHMEDRKKRNRNKRLVMMGLATVGGGLVIGLSAGLLAPVIGAGLAAGFTTFGVAGTGSFLAGAGGAAIITTTGIVTGSNIGFKASERRTGAVQTFEYRPLHNNKRVNLIVTVAGWLTGKVDDVRLPFSTVDPIMGDIYSVFWEPEMLQSMGDTINILATEALTQALQQVLGSTILVALMAALQLPIVLTKLAYLIDNPWTVSLARGDLAGLILADSLIDRNLGSRPITLVGFSLGSRVIYACLRELAKRGQFGIIQNVYMFGSPVVVKADEFVKLRSVVSGRFVNGYATNDWILGYLFRATSGGISRVAGLAPVETPGVENYNVTEFVPGHMSYRQAMPRLLREVGWQVESDEFTEIEDPDPENHESRQRELINEIEEARKKLQDKPTKTSRFGWFRKKEAVEKKDWEMYDEKVREGTEDKEVLEGKANGVLFDIEALRAEVAELAAQGIVVKELPESTLPPMKLDIKSNESLGTPDRMIKADERSQSAPPSKLAFTPPLRSISPSTPQTSQFTKPKTAIAPAAAAGAGTAAAVGSANPSSTLERSYTAPGINTSSSPFSSSISAGSALPVNMNLEHNAWADEFDDEFGKEKEMTMTFE